MESKTYTIDATDKPLGRLASDIAIILQGKHKPNFVPYKEGDDLVIVENIKKIKVTGKKMKQKIYYHHSGYPGGLKVTIYEDMIKKHPEAILEHAIKGMLPKNRLGRQMFKKLKVYAGAQHPHDAQHPEPLELH